MKFFEDDWLTIYQGDVRDVLPELASDSVDCIVTSPPYWGLRDYGTAAWSGGSEDCDHTAVRRPGPDDKSFTNGGTSRDKPRPDCRKCGAVRQDSQLGLERTPEEYVANMVAVFRELRRVLKPSGTCWLNLGDSYAHGTTEMPTQRGTSARPSDAARFAGNVGDRLHGLKPKDLVGIPWRVAFALQADGWYLRSDIIWAKPNPMPESVTDRPTKSHEYLFLLTKSARYYFDADAVREALVVPEGPWGGRTPRPGIDVNGGGQASSDGFRGYLANAGRNLRSVWTIATRPYPGAHFAVFPPELPERCIKAGSSERGVCPNCGAPWDRRMERTGVTNGANEVLDDYDVPGLAKRSSADRVRRLSGSTYRRVVQAGDWQATCGHYAAGWEGLPPMRPAVVLDPFAGSGTTGVVANRLSRRAILVDLNGDYLKQQLKRNAQTPLGLGA